MTRYEFTRATYSTNEETGISGCVIKCWNSGYKSAKHTRLFFTAGAPQAKGAISQTSMARIARIPGAINQTLKPKRYGIY